MKISTISAAVAGAALVLSLTGCGGDSGDTGAADTATPTAVATSEATTDTAEGCDFTENTGTSRNKKLQTFAVAQFESIDCASTADLTDQLTQLFESNEFTRQVEAQGWSANTGEALGAISVAIIDADKRTACTISVVDDPSRGKTVDCQDL
jgi:hypothetical protein